MMSYFVSGVLTTPNLSANLVFDFLVQKLVWNSQQEQTQVRSQLLAGWKMKGDKRLVAPIWWVWQLSIYNSDL